MKPKRNKFKASSKPKQRGIKVTGQWKPIEIDPNLFADEQLGGIICFEELANYKLVSSLKVGEEKAAKRKRNDEDLEKLCPATPHKKRKKGKKIEHGERKKEELEVEEKVIQQDASCEKALVEYEQDDYEPTEVTGLERNLPKKKKKGKKKKSRSPQNVLQPTGASKKANNWAAKVLSTKSDHKADVSAWKSLFVPKPVLLALSELGFSTPTPIQALTLPSAIRDSMDILGAAETGSGKTLAFAIPVIHSILQWYSSENMTSGTFEEAADSEDEMTKQHTSEETRLNSDTDETNASADDNESVAVNSMELLQDPGFDMDSPKQNSVKDKNNPLLGLVLTPTRELAVQVKHHIDAVAKFTDIKTAILVGGMAPQKQQRMLKRKPEIVIATPGRLWELIQEKQPHLSSLRQLRCLVIDEADRMVEKGHFLELSQLLEMLSDTQHNPKRQIFVFSATLTLIHQAPTRVLQKKNAVKIDRKTKLEMLMQKVGIRGKPKVIDLTRKEATVETLTETRIHCDTEEKDYYLYYFLLQYPGRTMVFANSIDCIKRLTALLTIMDCNPLPLHANMHQKQRLKNLERFAERNSCPLLTTDVAARGLDIPYVQHVIHYQVPRTSELYVHRSGRTARAANEGLSLLLIGPHDLINFKKIYKTLKKDEELPFFPVEANYMTAIKERVNLARQIEKIEYFNSRAKHENSWLQQAAEALELDLDDDELTGGQFTEREESEKHRMLKGMKKQLKHLLNQPVFRGLMKTKYPTQSGKLVLSDYTGQHSQSALSAISKAQVKKVKKKQK
ncbi:ATP-dependent RNA helicase DDX24 [Thamnophis elegans]|uniref:ATP-dependent RNA helicase DDX24 n=1 Tax=Thamnophis elegans TaxID=35005 RepID=UPI00137858BE|nr:ATP-dependent RNA helicase DDX24 [Thamnophis elegans]XP_032089424.1 ATP-dependent RNA helicase DDX24 [Thamnophis elegans]XP_032089432.1 ATP-dependent RNA helicase DDX24 [Thamnophis elegans]XP_032089441.1 ATP-dependent RNA helicase DDX24 [Thamnophis elegans]XP_032089450.1 ATP-dependent RNA helicase DDX24 [Thamnophis elegans]